MIKNISIMNLEDRVFFHEPVDYSIIHEYAKSADAGIALVQINPFVENTKKAKELLIWENEENKLSQLYANQ